MHVLQQAQNGFQLTRYSAFRLFPKQQQRQTLIVDFRPLHLPKVTLPEVLAANS